MIPTCKQRWGVLKHRCAEPEGHRGMHECECGAGTFYKAKRAA